MSNSLQNFESNWKRFETSLRGKLLSKANQQNLTLGLANIILKDASGGWFSMYDVMGKWLLTYSEENPAKGEIVSEIIKKDLKFTEEVNQTRLPQYAKYAVPIAAGLIGGGVAHLFSAKFLTVVVSAIVPAAALYPVVNSLDKNAGDSGKDSLVNNYVKQLEKYKKSIVSVIQN